MQHLIQCERFSWDQSSGEKVSEKWTEAKAFNMINGRNLADIARALKDIMSLVRVLDGIIDAPVQAKLDLDRERFEFDKRRSGQSDDTENECGIVIIPAIDDKLLDTALPDPDQPQLTTNK